MISIRFFNKFICFLIIAVNLFCNLSLFAQQQKIFYKEVFLSADPKIVQLVLISENESVVLKTLASKKLAVKDLSENNKQKKYAVLGFADPGLNPDGLLFSSMGVQGIMNSSIKVSESDLFEIAYFQKQQELNLPDLETNLKSLEAETIAEQKNLNQLKLQVAEISRLNRLVQAQNTVSSSERRLAELRQDRETLAALVKLVPSQQLSPRLAVLENQLVLDSKLISQAIDPNRSPVSLKISPEREQLLESQIAAASKLNVDDLRRRLSEKQQQAGIDQRLSEETQEVNEELEVGKGSRANPL